MLRRSSGLMRRLSSLASPQDIAAAVAANGAKVDLRTPEERIANPAPPGCLEWDFRTDPTMPSAGLPEDKTTPIVLF